MKKHTPAVGPDGPCCPAPERLPHLPVDEEVALVAKALGHPVRVQILRLLLERHECVCGEIVDLLPLAQSTVSQHLRVLRDAGLIYGETNGSRVCYCADPMRLHHFRVLLDGLAIARRE